MSKLFVGNLPKDVTENMLDAFFRDAQCHVENVKLVRDRYAGQAPRFAIWLGAASLAMIGRKIC